MLIATPYRDFDVRDKSPPKVISEIRKSYAGYCAATTPCIQPKISGDLLLKCGTEKNWWPRRVSIKGGQMHVSTAHGEDGPIALRLALRHLSLQAGPLPNSLSLCRGQNIILTLQTASERTFNEWVKTIAIELIRQTPLDAIKYLDILTIAECWRRNNNNNTSEKDWNYYNPPSPPCSKLRLTPCSNYQEDSNISISIPPDTPPPPVKETDVEDLLKKCQNVENYVPVKDKLFLFESLCKMDRKVRSTEDVSLRIEVDSKRARSMHDLSNLSSHIAVREICKYFENKNEGSEQDKIVAARSGGTNRRLVFSDSHLDNVYKFRKVIIT